MNCITARELVAFAAGDLPSSDLPGVEEHLDACPSCFIAVTAACRTSKPEVVPGPLLADGQHRYMPGPEIARGGMGRILSGQDRLLGRPVALKLLRRSSASLTRRFLREQRITARLQHPAIVPVLDAGVLDDGEPFFVMRLVKGQGLDRIAERAASPRERLQLLPAVLAAVDAVAYAHGEGVVHRDLKPQNVLVGPFGEVIVLDWGLARALDADTEPDANTDDFDPGASGERGMTRDRERLGTLAYMAPEQAAGHTADTRSDVYGLGAILYHVLSGRPPHAERTTSLSTRAVLHAPPPLALHVPDVPPDLVAIVARAMALEPEARYPSALELAADLRRWQAGRLVAAYHYSSRERLRRFVHRHRAPLLVGAAALLVLLALGAVGLSRILAERGRALAAQAVAEDAQAVAEDARLRADTQRLAAETLVQFILDDLRPRVDSLGRLDVLADVARAVIAFQDGTPSVANAEARLRRAQAAALAGDVAYNTGDLDAAEASYRRSREAAMEAADAEAVTLVRCRAANGLGDVSSLRREFAAAKAYYRACEVPSRNATSLELRAQSLKSKLGLAYLAMLQAYPSARALLEEGLAAALAAAGDPGSEISGLVISFRTHLTSILVDSFEAGAAHEMALANVALARARAEASPGAKSRYQLAVGLVTLGYSEDQLGDGSAAERDCLEALDLLRMLVAMDPANAHWQHTQMAATTLLAKLTEKRGDRAAALQWTQRNIDSLERSVASTPGDASLLQALGQQIYVKADQLRRSKQVDGARQAYQRASDIFEHLTELAPNVIYKAFLANALSDHGCLELAARRTEVGQTFLKRSIDLSRQVLATNDDPSSRLLLAVSLAFLAESERGPAARAHIEEAMALLEPLRGQTSANSPVSQEVMKDVARIHRALRARP